MEDKPNKERDWYNFDNV